MAVEASFAPAMPAGARPHALGPRLRRLRAPSLWRTLAARLLDHRRARQGRALRLFRFRRDERAWRLWRLITRGMLRAFLHTRCRELRDTLPPVIVRRGTFVVHLRKSGGASTEEQP